MQTLEYDDIKKQYPDALEELQGKFPKETFVGKPFEVKSNHEKGIVYLTVDGIDFVLTRQQALDLSYALSRHAKRIIKKQRKDQK